ETVRAAVASMDVYDDLHRLHRERVTRLCRVLLGDPDEAADTVQDVFDKLYRAVTTETRPISWSSWLTRVAVNACRDRRRSGWWRWWRERGVAFDETTFRGAVRTPEDEAIGHETQRRVWTALGRLPRRQREVFALRQLDGLTTDETAAALGIAAG